MLRLRSSMWGPNLLQYCLYVILNLSLRTVCTGSISLVDQVGLEFLEWPVSIM